MSLSERTKAILWAPFAISPIIGRFGIPGAIGIVLAAVGYTQRLQWLLIVGLVLAAPVIWALAVLLVIYVPALLVIGIKARIRK